MTDTLVCAGVSTTLVGMPNLPSDFSVSATIRMFKISGQQELTGYSFSNSNVVASVMGHIHLAGGLTENAGVSVSVLADSINSYSWQGATDWVHLHGLDAPGTADTPVDFLVRLI